MDGKEGFLHAFGLCRRNLRLIGLWPSSKKFKQTEICSVIRFVSTVFVILISVNIVQTIKLALTWGDLDTTSDIISTANLPIGLAVCKMLVFLAYRKELKNLLSSVKLDWNTPRNTSESENMSSRARLARSISLTCMILGFVTVNFHLLIRTGQELGLIPGKAEIRLPLFDGYFPFDYRPSPVYEFVWFMQYLGAGLATVAYSGIYCLFVALMLHICGQFANLRERLENSVDFEDDGNEGFRTTLVEIVERHKILNRCAQVIEDIFNFMFLAEIFACTLQFCMQGFLLVTISSTADTGFPLLKVFFLLVYVAHIGTHLFICCYVAEKFQDENDALFHAAYNCQWYCLSPKESVYLIMIMHRTSTPVQITAGKFFAFSLSLYAQIFKTSGGYLSMLLAVRDRISNA